MAAPRRDPAPPMPKKAKLALALAALLGLPVLTYTLYNAFSPAVTGKLPGQAQIDPQSAAARQAALNAIPQKPSINTEHLGPITPLPTLHDPIRISSSNVDAPGPIVIFANENALANGDLRCPLATGNAKADAAKHVTALCRDHLDRTWVGTEGEGIWCYDPHAADGLDWIGFGTAQGLGDNYGYAVVEDKLGRIWVGHLNHGVSVFNGQSWKNYDVTDGPAGCHVVALAVSPVNGDVWMGTNAGLTRYSLASDSWITRTTLDGLPSDQIASIAFDSDGTIYVATECNGLTYAGPQDDYHSWAAITVTNIETHSPPETEAPLINQLYVAKDHTLYVATTRGLEATQDRGRTWRLASASTHPTEGVSPAASMSERSFPSDYLTCIAEDGHSNIWVGTRDQGYSILSKADTQFSFSVSRPEDVSYVVCILPTDDGGVIGRYQGGVEIPAKTNQLPNSTAHLPLASLPTSCIPPDAETFRSLLVALAGPATKSQMGEIEQLPPDWRTQGSELGRYGRYWACFCGADAPSDVTWGIHSNDIGFTLQLPSPYDKQDTPRCWISTEFNSDPRSLEMPQPVLERWSRQSTNPLNLRRRQSEWDDHGEDYPMSEAGPGLDCTLTIPPGHFVLSFYNVNENGQVSRNRLRDYLLSVTSNSHSSVARIHQFWGGVYSRFLVTGPTSLSVHLDRNHSFNSNLNAIFLDDLDALPPIYYPRKFAAIRNSSGGTPLNDALTSMLCSQLVDKLKQSAVINTKSYARIHDQAYLAIARYVSTKLKTSAPSSVEATFNDYLIRAYTELVMFDQAEALLDANGVETARKIEQGLRWDGRDYPVTNECLQLIQAHWAKSGI